MIHKWSASVCSQSDHISDVCGKQVARVRQRSFVAAFVYF